MGNHFALLAVLWAFHVVKYGTANPSDKPVCEKDLPKWAHLCPKWAAAGDCSDPKKQAFMEHYCRKSCKLPCKPETTPNPNTKPPSPPAFCRDRDVNCPSWKSLGYCQSNDPKVKLRMAVYCGVTCNTCKAPSPEECFDKGGKCAELKKAGQCKSTVPVMEYKVKTNCLETCEFCVPDFP